MSEKTTHKQLQQKIHKLEQELDESKKLVGLLRESERKYRVLTEGVSDIVWTLDLDLKTTYVSPSVTKVLGFTPEERIGQEASGLMTPESYQRAIDTLAQEMTAEREGSLDPDSSRMIEIEYYHKNGQTVWTENAVRWIRDGEGQLVGIQGVSRDISERKNAEQILYETEIKFRTIFEKSPYPIALTEVGSGRIIEVNENFCQKTSFEKEHILGRTTTELGFYPPESRKIFVDLLSRNGKVDGLEMPFQTQNKIYTAKMFADFVAINNSEYVLTTFEDITERKQFEDALRESEERLHAILESNANPIVVYDAEGFPQYLNPAFTRVFGWTLDELTGQRIPFVPEDQKEITTGKIKEIYDSGAPVKFVSQRLTKQGKTLDVIVSAATIKGSEGEGTGMVVNLTDISEQRKLEFQLRQAQKMESVGRLAGGVAHDYNNMLSVILGYTEMAIERVDPADPLHEDLKEIFAAARHSADITRQLLAFARRQTISPKVLDINTAVEAMLKMLRRLIGEDIDLVWKPEKKLWPVYMDPAQLDQILANLCVNARDSIGGVGTVTIETATVVFDEAYCADHEGFVTGEFAMLAVSDDGSGMAQETLSHLFEPFFTTKKVGEGTGLGLATIYGIVKQNGGFINVYSEPDRGSSFRIYLPRHISEQEEEKKQPAEEVFCGRGETVLLVEDEPSILRICKKMLESLNYQVLAETSPDEAAALAERHPGEIHLLVTDVVMPLMNGRELAGRLTAVYPDLKILFMSGYTANVIAHRGVLEDGVCFIEKPFSRQQLAAKVREALDG
ncbi:MAG: PAS domain S-box protein [Desulfobacterales bacterium]|nr:PAS domain S-box protein [Desulfobacterales bacterium]